VLTLSQLGRTMAMDTPTKPILHCKLTGKPSQHMGEGTWVTYTLKNVSKQVVKILPWYTPLEGFMSDLFIVTDAKTTALTYQGPMIKRAAPNSDEYLTIYPNESVSAKVNLQKAYQISSGHYNVAMKTKFIQLLYNNQAETTQLCTKAFVYIEVVP